MIAIDWSGALSPAAQRRGIATAVCEVESGAVALRRGQLRSEVEAFLRGLARAPVVAGLDFSFSYPAWFVESLGCRDAPALWAEVAREGEAWLRTQDGEQGFHFWGRRKGSGPPDGHRAPLWRGYRRCERTGGHRLPSSSFQIGGAGAVGTATLRGMPMLARLRAAGWSVWPWDRPRLPMLVEIYPRLLTGAVVKSSAGARARYLEGERFGALAPEARAQASASEDAFDALISALVLREQASTLLSLEPARDEHTRLEGAIWRPELAAAAPLPQDGASR